MKRSLLILLLACFAMGADAHELSRASRFGLALQGANPGFHSHPYQTNPTEWVEKQEMRHRLQRLEDSQRWEWMQQQNRQGR